MKPKFLESMDQAFATSKHVILSLNTADRQYWPEENIGPLSLNYFLASYLQREGYNVAEYTPATGLKMLDPNNGKENKKCPFTNLQGQQDPVVVLNRIDSIMKNKNENWVFLIPYSEHIAPKESIGVSAATAPGQVHALEILHRISFDAAIASGKSRLVLITYTDPISPLLNNSHGYRNIQIGLPSYEERLAFIQFMEKLGETRPEKFGKLSKDIDLKEFAFITTGMPLINIESLYLASGYSGKEINREQVREAKAIAISQFAQDLLEVSEPEIGFESVAGLKPVVEYFKRLVFHIREGSNDIPQMVLLQGVPGCGKTHFTQATAHELGWPLIQLRSVRGPYVGQSEQQLERVIIIIEQLKPVVLLFDEIDQLIGQRGTGQSGDSGTSERLLARLFNWLGSMQHRGKILFIGTSNRPDLLDAALLDRSRTSFPIIKPSETDLCELIPVILNNFSRKFSRNTTIEKAANLLSAMKPSVRSLQEIIIQAGLSGDEKSGKIGSPISAEDLLEAAEDHLPIEDPLETEFITLTSLSMCSANSFLPWMGKNGLRPDAQIPEELISDGIVDEETGRLNKQKLHQKLRELKEARYVSRAYR